MQYRGTYIRVDLRAIAANTAILRRVTLPAPHMLAVVKANAYGHGLVQVAKTALQNGADWLGVAIPEEGERLREAGVEAPILVLGAVNERGAEASVRNRLTQAVFDPARVGMLEEAAARLGMTADMHLKCDTGMGRIGVRTEHELRAVLNALKEAPHVRLTGAFTHFADADGDSDAYSLRQIDAFNRLTALLPKGLLIHAAASAASLRYPQARYGMTRQGISLYGCAPMPEAPELKPALSWHTEIVYVKDLPAGACVSYGCTFKARKDMRVATLPVGYGDGYPRILSNRASVLVCGRRAPLVGRVCMDMVMADVTDIPEVSLDDEVVLLGAQGDERITPDELAELAQTIPYEIMLGFGARIPVQVID